MCFTGSFFTLFSGHIYQSICLKHTVRVSYYVIYNWLLDVLCGIQLETCPSSSPRGAINPNRLGRKHGGTQGDSPSSPCWRLAVWDNGRSEVTMVGKYLPGFGAERKKANNSNSTGFVEEPYNSYSLYFPYCRVGMIYIISTSITCT